MRILLFVGLCGCKEMTAWIVGGTVEAGKEVTSGIVEGVEEGRKHGESLDGAVVVTKLEELKANGGVVVRAVEADGAGSRVILGFDNASDKPLRISGLEVIALDAEGYTLRPSRTPSGATVPARAKDQVAVEFDAPPERVKTVRIWGEDFAAPTPATPAVP